MTDLILTRGIPASGKTTWARAWVAEDPENRARLNRDDFRWNMYADYSPKHYRRETKVSVAQQSAARALLSAGTNVVIDDTNLKAEHVKHWLRLAEDVGVTVTFQDFEVSLETAQERDMLRRNNAKRYVGPEVVASFYARYIRKGSLPPAPALEQVEQPQPNLYVNDLALEDAWLFDLDGTLAKMNGRGPFEWHRVGEDDVIPSVARIHYELAENDYRTIILSGRDEVCRPETKRWLRKNGIYPECLLMRPQGDNRPDEIVKAEIFWNLIAPNYNVLGVFDDRDKVVRMWRSIGLQCFQVAEGNF